MVESFSGSNYAAFDESEISTGGTRFLGVELNERSLINIRVQMDDFLNERSKIDSFEERKNFEYYNLIFEKIKEKLTKIESISPSNTCYFGDIMDMPEVVECNEIFNKLKKSTCEVYIHFEQCEQKLNEAKHKYTTFCDTFKEMIQIVDCCGKSNETETDTTLKQLLQTKIDSYYHNLELDKLINEYEESLKQFKLVKYKLSTIFGSIIPSTSCQICLENQVEYFLDPCGHTLCGKCKLTCENTRSTNCHYCRTKRNSFKKLFL